MSFVLQSMRTSIARATSFVAALAAVGLAVPAAAKGEKERKPPQHLRWAHSYAAALAEAKGGEDS